MDIREALTILQLNAEGLTFEILKEAYRTHARRSHPDLGGRSEEFIRVRQAYILLRNALLQGKNMHDYKSFGYTYEDSGQANASGDGHHDSNVWQQKWREAMNLVQQYRLRQDGLWETITQYESQINSIVRVFNAGQQRIADEQQKMKSQMEVLDKVFEEQSNLLKKRHVVDFWDIILWRKKLSRNEYVALHNELVREYNDLEQKKINKYNERIRQIYAETMNEMYLILSH